MDTTDGLPADTCTEPLPTPPKSGSAAARWLLGRLGRSILVIFSLVTVVFLLLRLAPGDPAIRALGSETNPEALAAMRERMGLNGPLLDQYKAFIADLLRFDLGKSLLSSQSINAIVAFYLPTTLWLLAVTFGFSLTVAIPLGLLLGTWRNRRGVRALRYLLASSLGVPAFFSGLVLILVFGLQLEWLPVGGYERDFPSNLKYLVLPALASAGVLVPIISSVVATAVSETIRSEFVENALTRNVRGNRLYLNYYLRPSLAPVIALIGYMIGQSFAAAVVTEIVFDVPGIGSALFSAILSRDYPIVQGVVLVVGAGIVLSNFVADLANAALDPRFRQWQR